MVYQWNSEQDWNFIVMNQGWQNLRFWKIHVFVHLFYRGVGAMELVAMDMKLRGMYIARQLSFKGVTFRIEEIPLDKNFVKVYNDSVRMVGFNANYAKWKKERLPIILIIKSINLLWVNKYCSSWYLKWNNWKILNFLSSVGYSKGTIQ